MKDFVSFGTDCQPTYFMSNRILKYKIDVFHVPLFQLAYICDTAHTSHKNSVKLFREVHYIWWVNKNLEPQEWDYCINSKKKKC